MMNLGAHKSIKYHIAVSVGPTLVKIISKKDTENGDKCDVIPYIILVSVIQFCLAFSYL